MKRILVAYATREGQTQKVADHLATMLRTHSFEVETIDVKHPPEDLALGGYAHVVLAASVHLGKHEREMVDFVRSHLDTLARLPTSFLSVSGAEGAAEDPLRTPEQRAAGADNVKNAIRRFLLETSLRPETVMPVAGALRYREYGWLVRLMMKRISKKEGGPTDTRQDYEMTDWLALDRFAESVAAAVAARP